MASETTLRLGIVEWGAIRKLAKLTFFDEEGNGLPITVEMEKIREVYRRNVEEILQHSCLEATISSHEFVAITDGGLLYRDRSGRDHSFSHTMAQTEEIWNRIGFLAKFPQLHSNRVEVALLDPVDLSGRSFDEIMADLTVLANRDIAGGGEPITQAQEALWDRSCKEFEESFGRSGTAREIRYAIWRLLHQLRLQQEGGR